MFDFDALDAFETGLKAAERDACRNAPVSEDVRRAHVQAEKLIQQSQELLASSINNRIVRRCA